MTRRCIHSKGKCQNAGQLIRHDADGKKGGEKPRLLAMVRNAGHFFPGCLSLADAFRENGPGAPLDDAGSFTFRYVLVGWRQYYGRFPFFRLALACAHLLCGLRIGRTQGPGETAILDSRFSPWPCRDRARLPHDRKLPPSWVGAAPHRSRTSRAACNGNGPRRTSVRYAAKKSKRVKFQ